MKKKPLLVVIGGPTCIGKSKLAITLAKKFNTEIISSDSRQFYKELNIGVAKLSKEKLNEVKHHLISNVSIKNKYTIGDYQRDFIKISNQLFKTKNIIFLCGGSGLYIDAVCKGFDKIPEVNPEIRQKLNNDFKKFGAEKLSEKLKKIDKITWEGIDKNNPRRLIRALEVFLSTKKKYSSFLNKKRKEKPFKTLYFFLNEKRSLLYEKINHRVNKMISDGLIEEVQNLTPHTKKQPLQTIGYKEIFDYLNNTQTLEKSISLIKQNTRKYAKRQITWFKSKKYIEIENINQKKIEETIEKNI